MVTIKDIAKLAGVSQSTVSKCLNDRPDVSPETKARVNKLAREFNFTPHAFGKALKRKTSENVGVLFCRDLHSLSSNPFYSLVLEGIEGELTLNNYNLVLQIITENTKDELPKMVREHQVDGLILVGTFRDSYLDRILNINMPIVLIDPKQTYDNLCHVLIDNEDGAFQAAKYLLDHGHTRIGFISGDPARLSFRQRYNGYVKALKYNKIPIDNEIIRTGGLENGYDHVKYLLEKKQISAIFSANDINAIYGYQAIYDMKLRIPDDISIIGFDDIDLARISSPPLTTVRVHKQDLGSIGVRNLLRLMHNDAEKPATIIVPTKLVERESVGYFDQR
jgi:LacI family transcriptional regulator